MHARASLTTTPRGGPRRPAFLLLLTAALACTPAPDRPDGAGANGERVRSAGGEVDVGAASDSGRSTPASPAACAPGNVGLRLPAGFCASLVADSLGGLRHVAVRANGDVFVARRSAPGGTGGVVALRDTTGDGRADVRAEFGPVGGTGIALSGDYLYLDARRAIVRYRLPAGALQPSGAADTIVSGLPTGGHEAHNFVLDGRGGLIVNIGSQTNSCQQTDRQRGSAGRDPCAELETRAGLWRFDANRTGQTFSAAGRWATGIRNAVAMARDPQGRLWVAQHGRDQLAQNWPERFDERAGVENPAEELQQVNQGDDFGWPYCFWSADGDRRVLAPEYGGDGRQVGRCARAKTAVATFPGHWAPMSLLFYTGTQLPARYRNGVFVAFHGSWNRAPRPQAGFNVVFQPLRDGRAAGAYEVVADGFAGGQVMDRNGARHRPVGLAQMPDGSILVTDDRGGRLYRLAHTGGR
jgi:glucose/arabinose dehydrogenase